MGADPSMYGKGLRPLSIATPVAFAITLSLVFFYAPIEADQGFLQKIFYLHVPLDLLPLVVPLMIAATAATEPLMLLGGVSYHRFGTWLMVLGLYDLIFALLGYAVFDFLLED